MTPFNRLLSESDPLLILSILRYVNAVRAIQGIPPRTTLRASDYTLTATLRIHCPFWLSCIDTAVVTPLDVRALQLHMQQFSMTFLPVWLHDWTLRHQELWHTYLKENTK